MNADSRTLKKLRGPMEAQDGPGNPAGLPVLRSLRSDALLGCANAAGAPSTRPRLPVTRTQCRRLFFGAWLQHTAHLEHASRVLVHVDEGRTDVAVRVEVHGAADTLIVDDLRAALQLCDGFRQCQKRELRPVWVRSLSAVPRRSHARPWTSQLSLPARRERPRRMSSDRRTAAATSPVTCRPERIERLHEIPSERESGETPVTPFSVSGGMPEGMVAG